MFELIVGNIGTVYTGTDSEEANRLFEVYLDQSANLPGCRAYGEDITLFLDGEPTREHLGAFRNDNTD